MLELAFSCSRIWRQEVGLINFAGERCLFAPEPAMNFFPCRRARGGGRQGFHQIRRAWRAL